MGSEPTSVAQSACRSSAVVCVLLAACALSACPAGAGEGWVVGQLLVDHCKGGASFERGLDYDMRADFYAGVPLLDATEALAERRNSVGIRIQELSNRTEEADGLLLQLHDLREAARRFSRKEPLPITADQRCPPNCRQEAPVLRAQFHLYSSCPDNKQPLVASPSTLLWETRADGERCLKPEVPTGAPGAASASSCPVLSAADRQVLDDACAQQNYRDRSLRPKIEEVLGRERRDDAQRVGGGACLYLCQLGKAQREMSAEQIQAFTIQFGEELGGVFYFNMVDERALQLNTCAKSRGVLVGMFRFELVRSRAAQTFP